MARQHYGNFFSIMRAVAPNIVNVGYGLGNAAYHTILTAGSSIKALGKMTFGIGNVGVNIGDGVINTTPEIKDTLTNLVSGNFCNSVESAFKVVEQISNTVSEIASTGANTAHEIGPDLSSIHTEGSSVINNVLSAYSNVATGISEVISYTTQASTQASSPYDITGTFEDFGIIGEVNSDWIIVE